MLKFHCRCNCFATAASFGLLVLCLLTYWEAQFLDNNASSGTLNIHYEMRRWNVAKMVV